MVDDWQREINLYKTQLRTLENIFTIIVEGKQRGAVYFIFLIGIKEAEKLIKTSSTLN